MPTLRPLTRPAAPPARPRLHLNPAAPSPPPPLDDAAASAALRALRAAALCDAPEAVREQQREAEELLCGLCARGVGPWLRRLAAACFVATLTVGDSISMYRCVRGDPPVRSYTLRCWAAACCRGERARCVCSRTLGRTPPLTDGGARCCCDGCALYSRVSEWQGAIEAKQFDKSPEAARLGTLALLGAVCRAFGGRMARAGAETITLCARHVAKASEWRVRAAALRCVGQCVAGAGDKLPPAGQEAVVRLALKAGGDKSIGVRDAAAQVLVEVCHAGSGRALCAALAFDQVATLCLRALEAAPEAQSDGAGNAETDVCAHTNCRARHANVLTALVAAAGSDGVKMALAQAKGKERDKLAKQVANAGRLYLAAPFAARLLAPGAEAARARSGLAEAWGAAVAAAATAGRNDEAQNLCAEALAVLGAAKGGGGEAASALAHARACVAHVLVAGGVRHLPPEELAKLVPRLLGGEGAKHNDPQTRTALEVTSAALATLGKSAGALCGDVSARLFSLAGASAAATRQQAAEALASLARSVPESATPLVSQTLEAMHTARGALGAARAALPARRSKKNREAAENVRMLGATLDGWARAAGALLQAAMLLENGVPAALVQQAAREASSMLLQRSSGGDSERAAGFVLAASLLALPRASAGGAIDALREDAYAAIRDAMSEQAVAAIKDGKGADGVVDELAWRAEALCALRASLGCHSLGGRSAAHDDTSVGFAVVAIDGAMALLAAKSVRRAAAKDPSAAASVSTLALRAFQLLAAAPPSLERLQLAKALLASCLAAGGLAGGWHSRPGIAPADLLAELAREDDILGPAVAGSDKRVDELHALECIGGDALVVAQWDADTRTAFAKGQSLAAALTAAALRALAMCFAASPAAMQRKISDSVKACAARKDSPGSATISALTLLLCLKAAAARGAPVEPACLATASQLSEAMLLSFGRGLRRTGAECLAMAAKLAGGEGAERRCTALAKGIRADPSGRGAPAAALALGAIHRCVGGMALRSAVGPSVDALMTAAARPTEGLDVHVWALHALSLVAQSAGVAYVPRVRPVLELGVNLLNVDAASAGSLGQCVARVVNATVACIGPELTPGSAVYKQCASVIGEVTGEDAHGFAEDEYAAGPATAMEGVLFAQQLALFAPQMPPRLSVLRRTLGGRQPSLRRAAAVTLRHLAESGAQAVCVDDSGIERDLFLALDRETDASVAAVLRQTTSRLLEAQCPSRPMRWVTLCSTIALEASVGRAVSGAGDADADGGGDEVVEGFEDDGNGIGAASPGGGAAGSSEAPDAALGGEDVVTAAKLRFDTRAFAARCLARVPAAVGGEAAHFDLEAAREVPSSEWLVARLGDVVGAGYKLASSDMQGLRAQGLELLVGLLRSFRGAADPDVEGHTLLEQYQVQVMSSLRANTPSDEESAPLPPPEILSAAARLAAAFVTARVAADDAASLKRVVRNLARLLEQWEALGTQLGSYAEWVVDNVRGDILAAVAEVAGCMRPQHAAEGDGSAYSETVAIIEDVLRPHIVLLRNGWLHMLQQDVSKRGELGAGSATAFEALVAMDGDGALSSDEDQAGFLLAVAVRLLSDGRGSSQASALRALPSFLAGSTDEALRAEAAALLEAEAAACWSEEVDAAAAALPPSAALLDAALCRAAAEGGAEGEAPRAAAAFVAMLRCCGDEEVVAAALAALAEGGPHDAAWRALLLGDRALARRAWAAAGPALAADVALSDAAARPAALGILASSLALCEDDAQRAAFLSAALPTLARAGGATAGQLIQKLAKAAGGPFAAVVGALPPGVKAELQTALAAVTGGARASARAPATAAKAGPGFGFLRQSA